MQKKILPFFAIILGMIGAGLLSNYLITELDVSQWIVVLIPIFGGFCGAVIAPYDYKEALMTVALTIAVILALFLIHLIFIAGELQDENSIGSIIGLVILLVMIIAVGISIPVTIVGLTIGAIIGAVIGERIFERPYAAGMERVYAPDVEQEEWP